VVTHLTPEIVEHIIKKAYDESRSVLLEPEAKGVCVAYRIPTPEYRVAQDPIEAIGLAEAVGFPVVLKIISRDILHKTEAGGVIVGLNSKDHIKDAYNQIIANANAYNEMAHIDGILVQHMAPKGVEVIVGGLRDSQFGPTVLFGLGGIFVEVLKDASFRVAPISDLDSRQMIKEIRSYSILRGARGGGPSDEAAIVQILQATSEIMLDNPEIQQVDLNPVMVYGKGATVVDARMILSK